MPTDLPDGLAAYHRKRIAATAHWLRERVLLTAYFREHAEERPAELARCATDPVWWMNRWAWTYDPRNANILVPETGRALPTDVPFVLYPEQERLVRWLLERERTRTGGIVEKSRDEGASWLVVGGYMVWSLTFRAGWSGGVGSRKFGLVDELDNLDALMPKARYQLEHMPRWMRPAYDAPIGRIVNTGIGSSITGEGGDEIGRGGRKSVYVVDEHAFIDTADRVERALSQTSPSIIRVSTSNGEGNAFHRLRTSKRVPVFTLHWTANPMKGREWYRDECDRIIDPVTIAKELDIDYSASVEGVCIPSKWVRAAVELALALPPQLDGTPVPFTRVTAGLDVSAGGSAYNVVWVRRGPVVEGGETWQSEDVPGTAFRAARYARERGASLLLYDAIGVGAGVDGTLSRAEISGLRHVPILSGAAPEDVVHDDAPTIRAGERFANLRAQLWWILRERFAKTYRAVTDGARYPLEDLISIPDNPTLIMQLSQPRIRYTAQGKILVEAKEDMAKRGIASPDHADALVYTFADIVARDPVRAVVIDEAVY